MGEWCSPFSELPEASIEKRTDQGVCLLEEKSKTASFMEEIEKGRQEREKPEVPSRKSKRSILDCHKVNHWKVLLHKEATRQELTTCEGKRRQFPNFGQETSEIRKQTFG